MHLFTAELSCFGSLYRVFLFKYWYKNDTKGELIHDVWLSQSFIIDLQQLTEYFTA